MSCTVFQKDGDMTFIVGTKSILRDRSAVSGNAKRVPHTNRREKKNAILGDEFLWPGAIIPYEISSVFNGRYVELNLLCHCTN